MVIERGTMLDGYVSKAIRKKKIFRVVPSNGAVEDAARSQEIDAYTATEAERKYRVRMRGKVHPLEPVGVTPVPEKGKEAKGKAEWLQR